MVGALYEVGCEPSQVNAVASALAAIPQVASVYLTGGAFDMHALVVASDMGKLSRLLLDRLPLVPGIVRVRSSVGTTWYSHVRWRLGAIDASQEELIRGDDVGDRAARVRRAKLFSEADRALYLALQHDGRARYRDLATELGVSEQLAKRRLTTLTRDGVIALRTDFTRGEGGWPAQVALWLGVDDARADRVGDELSRWPETRFCLAAFGPANLFLEAQLHRLDEHDALLERIRTRLPEVTIVDRRPVLRAVKSWGRVLDPAGHATTVVPVDPWAEPSALAGDR
jgi:DNA-binding Lrp family transcriptional regulator